MGWCIEVIYSGGGGVGGGGGGAHDGLLKCCLGWVLSLPACLMPFSI